MTTLRRRTNSEREIDYRTSASDPFKNFPSSNLSNNQKILFCEMTCRDRTAEFLSVVKNKQGKLDNGYIPTKRGGKFVKGIGEWSNFMQVAKQIGKDISSTFAKLEKLTLLAKKKSLFDDQPVEVQELIYIIKQDITSLNKQISQLQELSKARNNNHGRHMQSHSNSVVVSLQSKLASMSNDFRHVLEVRTQNLKHQKQRREQFTDGPVSATLPASALSGHTGSILLSDDYNYGEKEVAVNMDGINQQQMQLIDEQDSYIQTRADAMQNIEATIVELGTIFKELAHMVKEQEELVQRIDSNVEDA
ncbi:hypothetical protein X975_13285, partial [Stegodyphus mimosarum]